MESRVTRVQRVQDRYDLHFVDAGSGEPVLLIHGLAGDHHAWETQIDAWSRTHRVIAPDSRGAGRSTQIDEKITLGDMARDFLELMTKLGIERFQIVGRSMGGCIAQLMALEAPQRVTSMVWMASCARFDSLGLRRLDCHRDILARTGSWASWSKHAINDFVSDDYFRRHPEEVKRIESLIAGTDRLPACYLRQSEAVVAHDELHRLAEIRCPTLVLSGAQDPLCGPLSTKWMVDARPGTQWVEFAGSHFFFLEEPEKFMKVTTGWLRQHSEAAVASN
jgi:3-oxoadipate enol-lactonase